MKRIFATFVALIIALPAWAEVKLQLDRDRVMVGETVTLTFVSDDARQSFDADLSALQEDFEILDNRTERQMSIVNGSQTTINRLLLTVEPKHDGDIQIPSFTFGNSITQPALLRGDPAPELAPGELPAVFIEVELTPGEGPYYVHAQFGLVMRLFYLQSLTEAAISTPAPAPAYCFAAARDATHVGTALARTLAQPRRSYAPADGKLPYSIAARPTG